MSDRASALPLAAGDGLHGSDKCSFCGEYGIKAKPFICVYCWYQIRQVVKEHYDELVGDHPNLNPKAKGTA